MRVPLLLSCLLLTLTAVTSLAQDSISVADRILQYPDRIFNVIDRKTADIESKLIQQTDRYLRKLAKQEQKLQRKLSKIDSLAAKEIFGNVTEKYAALSGKLKSVSGKLDRFSNVYSPRLDSLQTSLRFLHANNLLGQSEAVQNRVKELTGKMQGVQGTLNQTDAIKKYLDERKTFLKEKLQQFGMVKELEKFKREVYYYKAQVEEYKNMFENPSRLEEKVLGLLSETKLFRDFFANHSELASIFRLPGSNEPNALASSIPGLQSRSMVMQDLQGRFGSGPNINELVQQNVDNAMAQLNGLKDKLNKLGTGGGELDMPDFKPNSQRTKSFLQRIELGSDMQSVRSTNFFPTTTDMAFTAGYKINDKSIVGLGLSSKIGWGKNIQRITISYEGIGMRSFLDWKIKFGLWMSGGAELNYKSQFTSITILKDFSPWQRSALLGMKKVYQAGKMKGTVSVLYDFLYKQQVPATQPLLFRVGCNFQKR